MSKPTILIQLDTDPQPSVFDAVVAVDSGVTHLFRHAGVTPDSVVGLVHGAVFTRGVDDLRATALFVGGSDVAAGEAVLAKIRQTFFGPMRVSVMLDSNGANTTASAAVLAAGKHLALRGATALVLAGTGPVGQRAARLLAGEGARVRVASRHVDRARKACEQIAAARPGVELTPVGTGTPAELAAALDGAEVVIAAGAAGVELLSASARAAACSLRVAIDLNAVPPVGLAGIEATDKARDRDGQVCYGALGVGGAKMKLHKRAVARLFETNDQVLDADELYALGKSL